MKTLGNYREPIPEHLQKIADTLFRSVKVTFGTAISRYGVFAAVNGNHAAVSIHQMPVCCGAKVLVGFPYEASSPHKRTFSYKRGQLARWSCRQAVLWRIHETGGGTRFFAHLTESQKRAWGPVLTEIGFIEVAPMWRNSRTGRMLTTFFYDHGQ